MFSGPFLEYVTAQSYPLVLSTEVMKRPSSAGIGELVVKAGCGQNGVEKGRKRECQRKGGIPSSHAINAERVGI